jgi:hypothetical protein
MKYILIAFTFVSCINNSQKSAVPVSTEPLDTVKFAPAKVEAQPVLFETAFIKGTKQKLRDLNVDFFGVTIGKLKVPSGYIAACDPYLIEEYGIPFTQAFPKGEFPVQLSIAQVDTAGTIAFARIQFSDEPVAKWEYALLKEQTPIPLDSKESYGYIVDAGSGSFMDAAAAKALDANQTSLLSDNLYKQMNKHFRHTWRYAMYNFGQHNIAAFTAGVGDGRYSTYIGYDAQGKPCRLVTDFGFFEWKKK